MARPEKVAVVDEINEKITSAGATVITEYRGLTVTELATLRAALREAGASYKIYKNSLAKRAVEAADLADAGKVDELLLGPTAWAFVDGDLGAAAKALKEFSKTNEALVVKGGLLEGAFLTPEQVDEIAELPSREELLARIAGGFKAPMAKAAGLFSVLQRNTAYAIKALIDKRIEAGESPAPADAEETGAETEAPAGEAAEEAAEASVEGDASPEASSEDAGTEEESGPEASVDADDDSEAEAAADGSSAETAEDVSPEAAGAEAEEEAAEDDAGQAAEAEDDGQEAEEDA